jgi:hypothetical protein
MATSRKPKSTKVKSQALDRLSVALDEVQAELSISAIGPTRARKARARLEEAARILVSASEKLDPIRRPDSSFDPSNTAHTGRFIALTLIAQDRKRLASVERFYGAGVYAIYYTGPLNAYRAISKTEHPVYVGKADPAKDRASTPVEQGTRLWRRLNDHRKSIAKSKLNLDHFECRFLVVASGWQTAAEEYLISLFRPIWNKQVKLVYGIGKHGDSADTRGNRRSPWDTLHFGRAWAGAGRLDDQKSVRQIRQQLREHFSRVKPYKNFRSIFSRFISEMRQLPALPKPGEKVAR